MSGSALEATETVVIATLFVGLTLLFVSARLRLKRPDFDVRLPLGVGLGLRLLAIAGIASTGLETALRGGDETTFLARAHFLAVQPFGHGFLPHSVYQLHTVLFAIEIKLANFSVGAMRITQVGIAMLGVLLIVAAVHDLAGGRAARLTAWLLALEPAAIFFNSALHKEPLMELATGLVVFGGAKIWRRLDPLGIVLCAIGGLIAVETRSYAGWFLVSASVLLLLHASLRQLNRPLVAMPLVYLVAIVGFIATPVLLQASSKGNLQQLQLSQNANATGAGQGAAGGPNSSNLKLEQVDYSTRGKILSNLPQRIRDVILKPYPWQLQNSSQRFGAIGTLVAWAGLLMLIRYAWRNRGRVFQLGAPMLYPLLFMLVAYSLSAGNAGTSFRYRTHLVTLGFALMVVLRESALRSRATVPAAELPPPGRWRQPAPQPTPVAHGTAFDSAQRA
jgi:hypothetical protein